MISKIIKLFLQKKKELLLRQQLVYIFQKKLITELKKKINFVYITLHVNGGTFLPIKTENIFEHNMHSEFGTISKKSAGSNK